MKLYFSPHTSSLAAHIALEWIGQPFELHEVEIRPGKSPELVARNPMGAVPVLEDAGWILTQNVAVLNYLADRFPEAGVGSDGTPRGRAELNRWLGFINSDLHPYFEAFFGEHGYLQDKATIEKTVEHSRVALRKRLALVDEHLKDRDFLLGARHSVADGYLFIVAEAATAFGVDLADLTALLAFVARMRADPAVQRALAAESAA
ncbi:MAG TPA: glutathione S-transferase N-terminal domain-containing protein [Nevskiaceae bacterium]